MIKQKKETYMKLLPRMIIACKRRPRQLLKPTFRCMNFCRGSYHNSRTRPDGTAAHRNVLSVYGFLAKDNQKVRETVDVAVKHRTHEPLVLVP